jgi:hypothetical protein
VWAKVGYGGRYVKRLVITLTLILTTATAVSVSPASAGYVDPFGWKKCNKQVDGVKITAAKDMGCRGAKRVIARYDGSYSRNFSAGKFSCKLVKGKVSAGTWRCKNKSKAFKFKRS